jgi:hypothetical protein
MSRWLMGLCIGGLAIASFACKDDLVEEVPKDVCYSGLRWIGEKRGDPEMFPGRDCVGCHLANDGPPLAIGGTLYPYVLSAPAVFAAQSGTDCFGVEGYTLTITDADGQEFPVTTNRAGNFYVEGNPDDFAKPFSVRIKDWDTHDPDKPLGDTPMGTKPSYGGCANCHTPGKELVAPDPDHPDRTVFPTARIGLPGFLPAQKEIEAMAAAGMAATGQAATTDAP